MDEYLPHSFFSAFPLLHSPWPNLYTYTQRRGLGNVCGKVEFKDKFIFLQKTFNAAVVLVHNMPFDCEAFKNILCWRSV